MPASSTAYGKPSINSQISAVYHPAVITAKKDNGMSDFRRNTESTRRNLRYMLVSLRWVGPRFSSKRRPCHRWAHSICRYAMGSPFASHGFRVSHQSRLRCAVRAVPIKSDMRRLRGDADDPPGWMIVFTLCNFLSVEAEEGHARVDRAEKVCVEDFKSLILRGLLERLHRDVGGCVDQDAWKAIQVANTLEGFFHGSAVCDFAFDSGDSIWRMASERRLQDFMHL